jgi:ubiquitin C-terminal hydrolase
MDNVLVEDEDYVALNKTTWMLLVRLYNGGPQLQVSNYEQTNNFYLTPTIGLYNEENYSFLNLALQALFSLELFLIYFLKRKYKNNKEQKLC